MGLPSFVRRILGPNRFPVLEGQEIPDPVLRGPARSELLQEERSKVQNRTVKIRTKPESTPKP